MSLKAQFALEASFSASNLFTLMLCTDSLNLIFSEHNTFINEYENSLITESDTHTKSQLEEQEQSTV